jgi:hypothetical protein
VLKNLLEYNIQDYNFVNLNKLTIHAHAQFCLKNETFYSCFPVLSKKTVTVTMTVTVQVRERECVCVATCVPTTLGPLHSHVCKISISLKPKA